MAMDSKRRGATWGLAVAGLFVWFVLSAGLMANGRGVERWIGAAFFFAWVALMAALIGGRRRRA